MYFLSNTKDQLWEYFAEFSATKESVIEGIRCLKQWLEQEQYLPKLQDDDQLANFLFRGKNNLERTKKIIDLYYSSRALMPEIFDHLDPCSEEVMTFVKKCAYVPMPKVTEEGYRILVFHIFEPFGDYVPNENVILRANQIALDMLLWYDQCRGYIVIFDLENMSLHFIRQLMLILKKLFSLTTKVSPLRWKKVYVCNVHPFTESVVVLGKSFVKKELSDRIIVWREPISRLTTILPKGCLPQELNGSEKSLVELRDNFYDEARRYKEWFTAEKKVKADLTKKPRDIGYSNTEFGVEGSFRKINLD